ncbi:MAG: DNA primase [Anaerolineae bacterium]|nr:DNA primase [Anaerolineae bacterium]
MSAADEIKARLDIVSYIQQYAPLKRAGKSWKACCPFHNERTPSFVVNPDTQSWRCFGQCAEGGDVISFAMKKNGWTFTEALQELGKLTGVEVRQRSPEEKQRDDRLDTLRGLMQAAADGFHDALLNTADEGAAAALAYVRQKRGFTDETIQQYKIGYALPGWNTMLDYLKQLGYSEDQIVETGMAVRNDNGRVYDRFRNRLMIPIRDERGRVIGFGARALAAEDNPKYLNSPQTPLFDKSKTLFGLDVAKSTIRESETAVIVEGYMDAIQAHQAGFRNVVAQMGTAMTETQIRLLSRMARKVILALDSDAAGQNATRRSLETARATLQADYAGHLQLDMRVLHIPGAKDPDELIRETPEQWSTLVAEAMPVADFVIEMEMAALPPNASLQEREAVARRLLPMLVASENDLYKKDNIQKLALRLRIVERDLLAWADEQRQIIFAQPPKTAPRSPKPFDDSEPPDYPPLDFDESGLPPIESQDSDYVQVATVVRGAAVRSPRKAAEVAMEQYCLRALFQRPDSYYAVNRKLREIAASRRELQNGPLADWGAEDFTQTEMRALMQTFLAAMEQDDLDPLAYVWENADPALHSALTTILADELHGVRTRVNNGLSADLLSIWENNRRPIDYHAELIEKALRLRARRLQREREELCFLQMDVQRDDNPDNEDHFQYHIALSSTAKGLIEAELMKQMPQGGL